MSTDEYANLRKKYKKMFGEEFDLCGLYWNDRETQMELMMKSISEKKNVFEILSDEEKTLIERAERDEILF